MKPWIVDEVGDVPPELYAPPRRPVLELDRWQVTRLEAKGIQIRDLEAVLGVRFYIPEPFALVVSPARALVRFTPWQPTPADWRYSKGGKA